MLRPMARPNSVVGLFRRFVVLRWKKLSLNTRLAILAAAVLLIAAVVSGALGFSLCPASGGCCLRGEAAATAPAEHPVITAEARAEGDGCPFSSER